MIKRLLLSRRRVSPISLAFLLALVLGAVQLSAFRVQFARAATRITADSTTTGAIPSAAADNQDNRFVFWRGVDPGHGLWEGFYQASVNTWYGPISIPGMGTLGSEPAATVDTSHSSQGYAHQFVFWQGSDAAHGLWEAYWDGSWHGPIDLGMGPLGSKPSAAYDAAYGILTVVWKGMDGNLWYTYNQLTTSGQPQSWRGPFSAGWGPLGGPPAAADAGYGTVLVSWRGTNSYLWYGELSAGGNPYYGPGELQQAGIPGSDPDIAGNPAGTFSSSDGDYFTISWTGLDQGLWTIRWSPVLGTPAGRFDSSPTEIPNMGPLGSAPSCVLLASFSYECYWAGANAGYDLWTMIQDFNGISGPNNLGMGPLR